MSNLVIFMIGVLAYGVLHDAIYSISIYWNSYSYTGEKQTFKRDHWIRVCRAVTAIVILVFCGVAIG